MTVVQHVQPAQNGMSGAKPINPHPSVSPPFNEVCQNTDYGFAPDIPFRAAALVTSDAVKPFSGSPGTPERERPVSGVISEDAKSGLQALPAPAPLLSPLTFESAGY